MQISNMESCKPLGVPSTCATPVPPAALRTTHCAMSPCTVRVLHVDWSAPLLPLHVPPLSPSLPLSPLPPSLSLSHPSSGRGHGRGLGRGRGRGHGRGRGCTRGYRCLQPSGNGLVFMVGWSVESQPVGGPNAGGGYIEGCWQFYNSNSTPYPGFVVGTVRQRRHRFRAISAHFAALYHPACRVACSTKCPR